MEKILQRIYLTDCNLLILKDLRRAHKIKWKCRWDDKKKMKLVKLDINIVTVFLNT